MDKSRLSPGGATPDPLELRALAMATEQRQRRARAMLQERAAACRDPALGRLLARAAAGNHQRATRTAAWLGRGKGLPPKTPPTEAAARRNTEDPLLRERIDVTPDLLILRMDRPAGFEYRAGQHVKMGVPGLLRTFSLVSAPHEPHLEFFVELVPGGQLAERLRPLRPGAAMALDARAKGDLSLDPARPRHLMVATVTGIAPYVSLLRDHFHRGPGDRRFIVLVGASHGDELGYRDELEALAARHPGAVTVVPTISRPQDPRNAGWQGATGRVDVLAATAAEDYGLAPGDTAVYACGNPGMVDAVASHFMAAGFAVYTEPYD
ncbi:MAG: FAD-binding oxidoreductase [Gammaproteobacteria bacterium]|nr:FAD-binding oxidoreductase [Gammaproteobacteria bacterium]